MSVTSSKKLPSKGFLCSFNLPVLFSSDQWLPFCSLISTALKINKFHY